VTRTGGISRSATNTEPASASATARPTRSASSTQSSGRAAAAQVPRPFLERLVGAFARSGVPIPARSRRGGTIVAGLVEPLTARELEVLELLAAGLPNQAIADELVITLDTVKRHVSHILGKLAATNRTQAGHQGPGAGAAAVGSALLGTAGGGDDG
jgi:DNA-binding NarL/FixJ family response regulator